MNTNKPTNISNFFVAGINYKKTDSTIRGQFAINSEKYQSIIESAPIRKVESFFILSTCNRTEIYGLCENVNQLIGLLCSQTLGSCETFMNLAYTKQGTEAIVHLFHVGSGLDSQILGDYEITGQLKQAVKFSKDRGFINCFLERLFNSVLQSSKIIKNATALTSGVSSVSFAAVQYIKSNVIDISEKKILLLGTGKLGRNTCKNMVDYLGNTNITVINRSESKAYQLATELNLKHAPLSELAYHIAHSDIILTATNACEPIILRSDVENNGTKLIIDLSVPTNIENSVNELPYITTVSIDKLTGLNDETLQKRKAEIPKAKQIIEEHQADFLEWHNMRKNAPVLVAIKTMLTEIYLQHKISFPNDETENVSLANAELKIQRVINGTAGKMRLQNHHGCNCIEAINEFMSVA